MAHRWGCGARPRYLAAQFLFGLAILAPPADGWAAQSSATGDDDGLEKPQPTRTELDVLVVSSQFRPQSITEVPLAITAYDDAKLQQLGIDEFGELDGFVPGFVVQAQSVNNTSFVVRGLTSSSGASNFEPRVAVFQNGVSIARPRGSSVRLFDLERIEVLKGPQGTLFGRSAEIGAVHVLSQRPAPEFDASVELGAGNFGARRAEAMVNVPLSGDTWMARFAGLYESRDGFAENNQGEDLNGVDSLSLRGSLRYAPSADLTVDLIANYAFDQPSAVGFKSGVIPAEGGDIDLFTPLSASSFGGFLGRNELFIDRSVIDVTAIVDWQFSDNWKLQSTSAYRTFDSLDVFDADASAFDIFVFAEDAEAEQWSMDFRFNYDNGGRLKGFFGGGVFAEEGNRSAPLGVDVINLAAFFLSLGNVTDPNDSGEAFIGAGELPLDLPFVLPPSLSRDLADAYRSGEPQAVQAIVDNLFPASLFDVSGGVFQVERVTDFSDTLSFDLFSEFSYALTDDLEFTVGARFTRDQRETRFFSTVDQPNPLTPIITQGLPGLIAGETGGVISSADQPGLEDTFGGFSWRAVLNYQLGANKFAYFNYSRGRRAEVIQDEFTRQGSAVVGGFEIVPAETVDSYEIGFKGAFYSNRIVLDLASYFYDYNNFQTAINVAGPGEPPDLDILNGGTAQAYGVELGLTATPRDDVSFFVTYGYNRGRFDERGPDGQAQAFGGNRFAIAPDHTLSLGANLELQTPVGRAFVTPTYTWKSDVFFTDENQEAYRIIEPQSGDVLAEVAAQGQEAFGLINIRGGIDLSDQVTAELFVQNLADKDYLIEGGGVSAAFGIPSFIAGPPRFYGGSVTFRY